MTYTHTTTTYIWNPASHETTEVEFQELTALIYAQLLELYIHELEVELMCEKLRNVGQQLPQVPVTPRQQYPWDQPPPNPWNIPWRPGDAPIYYGPPYKVTCLAGDNLKYSEEYDAYYDPKENVWTEDKCSDANCEYCVDRPERPL